MELDPPSVIDRIYEAALVPERWQATIDDMCAFSGSLSGSMILVDTRWGQRGIASTSVNEVFQHYIGLPGFADQPRTEYALKERPRSFVCMNDVIPVQTIALDPGEQALNEAGACFQVGFTVSLPSGEVGVFTFERAFDRGRHSAEELEQLELLRPHLSRAALLSARMGLDRISTLLGGLDAIGLPAAALRANGQVVAASAAFEANGVALPGAFDKVVIQAPAAHALFLEALQDAASEVAPMVRSIPVPAWRGAAPKVLHLVPIRGAAHDVFTRAEFLLVVTTFGTTAAAPDLSLLHGLFDLTPKEAQLAAALASGKTLQDAAAASGTRYSTARTHLEHIFQKTGMTRQSDLVLLLQRARPLP